MIKGAIHINDTPRNYRFREIFESDWTTDAGYVLEQTLDQYITWGLSYSAGTTGIRINFNTTIDGVGAKNYIITIVTPWGTFTYTNTDWLAYAQVRIEIDDLELAVATDCDFTLDFTELRIYVDQGAGEVLEETIGAQSESGALFDLRKDVVTKYIVPMDGETIPTCTGSSTQAPEDCGENYLSQPTYHNETNASGLGGYQFFDGTWQSDAITIDLPDLPITTCDCPGEAPICAEIDPYDSYNVKVTSRYINDLVKFYIREEVCDCVGRDQVLQYFDKQYNVLYNRARVVIIPESSGIINHRHYATIGCGVDTDTTDVTQPELITLCEAEIYVDNQELLYHCCDVIQIGICTPEEICGVCDPDDTIICCTTYNLLTEWPDLPSCVNEENDFTNYHTPTLEYMEALIADETNIKFRWSSVSRPIPGWDFETLVTTNNGWSSPTICEDKRTRRIWVGGIFESNAYLYYTDSNGQYFTEGFAGVAIITNVDTLRIEDTPDGGILAVGFRTSTSKLIGSYKGPSEASFGAEFTFKDDSGTDLVLDTSSFDISSADDGQQRINLICRLTGSADAEGLFSCNDGLNWKVYP